MTSPSVEADRLLGGPRLDVVGWRRLRPAGFAVATLLAVSLVLWSSTPERRATVLQRNGPDLSPAQRRVPIALGARPNRYCIGHAAYGSALRLSQATSESKRAYADRNDYDFFALEAPTLSELTDRYCPELAAEVALSDAVTGTKSCAIWYALERQQCTWMAWIDPSLALLPDSEPLEAITEDLETQDSVWFLDANSTANETGSCGTTVEFAAYVDTSMFALRRQPIDYDWINMFVHYKLSFGGFDAAFLKRSKCTFADEPLAEAISRQCDLESSDRCTTGCLYRYHPQWLWRARCFRRPWRTSADGLVTDPPFAALKCEDDEGVCLQRTA